MNIKMVLTLFKCTLIVPLASMVAVSPRNETTLPSMRTVWLVKESRYFALIRGVASEAMVVACQVRRVWRRLVRGSLPRMKRQGGGCGVGGGEEGSTVLAREHVMKLGVP